MGIFSAKKVITQDTVLSRKPNLLFNVIDDEVVMLSIENSEYYGMEKVGSRIWELLEKPLSFGELVEYLMDEYDITKEKCIEDSVSFLEDLVEKKLIETK